MQEGIIEVRAASNWWASNLDMNGTNTFFRDKLEILIYERIKDHWYPDHPSKGSGYRSIICDYHIDPLLIKACRQSRIDPRKLPQNVVQIISPGIVRARSMIWDKEREPDEIIYKYDCEYSPKSSPINFQNFSRSPSPYQSPCPSPIPDMYSRMSPPVSQWVEHESGYKNPVAKITQSFYKGFKRVIYPNTNYKIYSLIN